MSEYSRGVTLALALVVVEMLIVVAMGVALAFGQTPTTQPRVQQTDLVYEGAFGVPLLADSSAWDGGGRGLVHRPQTNTLFLSGLNGSRVAEITIAAPRTDGGLNRATLVQPLSGLFLPVWQAITAAEPCDGGVTPSGLLVAGDRLIAAAHCGFDGGFRQIRSHAVTSSLTFSQASVAGPIEVQSPVADGGRAGWVSGWMARIPTEWQSLFGGDALTGNCCVSIITRTSFGPSASVFSTADVGVKSPVPTKTVLGYTQANPLDVCDVIGRQSAVFNCGTRIGGVQFIDGTRTVLFVGLHGLGKFCYGESTPNQSLDLTPVAGQPGNFYCYDTAVIGKGYHAYPYVHMVWAYDANDLLRVKNGEIAMWQVKPYATWPLALPGATATARPTGMTFDPVSRRLYISVEGGDAYRPRIHVFRVSAGSSTPTDPTPTPTDAVVSAWSAWTPTSPWGICHDGAESQTQERTRTVLQPATNGGTTPALRETQIVSRPCGTVTPELPSVTWTLETNRCTLRVLEVATTAAVAGRTAQFQRWGPGNTSWVNFGSTDATAPYGPRTYTSAVPGDYRVRILWLKSGAAPIEQDLGTETCQ